jgi:hypothetical protein
VRELAADLMMMSINSDGCVCRFSLSAAGVPQTLEAQRPESRSPWKDRDRRPYTLEQSLEDEFPAE